MPALQVIIKVLWAPTGVKCELDEVFLYDTGYRTKLEDLRDFSKLGYGGSAPTGSAGYGIKQMNPISTGDVKRVGGPSSPGEIQADKQAQAATATSYNLDKLPNPNIPAPEENVNAAAAAVAYAEDSETISRALRAASSGSRSKSMGRGNRRSPSSRDRKVRNSPERGNALSRGNGFDRRSLSPSSSTSIVAHEGSKTRVLSASASYATSGGGGGSINST